MAAVEAGEGHASRAARLLGASQELAERIGVTLDPFERAMRERTVQATVELLDEQQLDRERRLGRTLSAEDAVAFALSPRDARRARIDAR